MEQFFLLNLTWNVRKDQEEKVGGKVKFCTKGVTLLGLVLNFFQLEFILKYKTVAELLAMNFGTLISK
jgi:hypothetical protein